MESTLTAEEEQFKKLVISKHHIRTLTKQNKVLLLQVDRLEEEINEIRTANSRADYRAVAKCSVVRQKEEKIRKQSRIIKMLKNNLHSAVLQIRQLKKD